MAGTSGTAGGPPWWRTAVTYQVYIRSFADGDGDGVGDVSGIRSRLDHLVRLGVDALWITPWYPSPMRDGGYDVSDHFDVDPLFGTLGQARGLLADAHGRGLRVLVDLVANHTSTEHVWFREALVAPPGSPARARYHFRDGRRPDGAEPPNDWISAFGGSAWTRTRGPDGRPGQWYLHLFAAEQPDLNWTNPDVRAHFDDVVRFWLGLGVDGLRVDAASAFAKHPGLPDHGFVPGDVFDPRRWPSSPLWDVEEVHDVLRSWRRICDEAGQETPRVLVGEVTVSSAERLARYLRPDELHTAFALDLVKAPWDGKAVRARIADTLTALGPVGAPATWVLSNHDETRHVTRFGRDSDHRDSDHRDGDGPGPGATDLALGTRRARAAALLLLALPGCVALYQGEELGLPDVEDLPDAVRADPVWHRTGGAVPGRDGCRVPLPWSGSAPPFGFTAGTAQPWLPQPPAWTALTVEAQDGDPSSMLSLYQAALQRRRELVRSAGESFAWVDEGSSPSEDVVAFDRGPGWRCLVNLGRRPVPFQGEVLLASLPLSERVLPPDAAVWVVP